MLWLLHFLSICRAITSFHLAGLPPHVQGGGGPPLHRGLLLPRTASPDAQASHPANVFQNAEILGEKKAKQHMLDFTLY